MNISTGQVLWLKLPFGKTDEISKVYHPYLIIESNKYGIEVGQMDSENEHPWEVLRGNKIPVDNENPKETVIYTASYLQTDRKIQIEYFDELKNYMDTVDVLSENKFRKIINSYYDKRNKYGSDNFRDMYFAKEEILKLNPMDEWVRGKKRRIKKYVG